MPPIAGNVLGDLGRALAQDIGPYQLVPVTATSADALHVTSVSARDTEAPASRHGGKYLYSHGPSVLGEQQRVTRDGFVGSTGVFTVAGPFTTQPQLGTAMSLMGTIPWSDQDDLTGLRTCINRSLQKRWVVDRYPITSTGPDTDEYDLGALWWMTERRCRRLYGPDPTGSGHPEISSVSWRVRHDGEIWVLELGSGFPTGEIFSLECEMPAAARLYTAQTSSWVYTAGPGVGMRADGDACLGSWNDAYQTALYEVYRQLAIQAGGTRKSYWRDRAQEQRLVCSSLAIWLRDAVDEVAGETVGAGRGSPSWPKGLLGQWP